MLAASVPSKMYPVGIALNGSSVDLTWVAPNSNGSPITQYSVLLLNQNTGQYNEYPTLCDGSNPAVLTCQISMSDFISTLGYFTGI